ncbi:MULTISPECIES: aminotransferase class I/II-fold pyridoxal phosphate-dependent enzyme [Micromonospora]|uniref:Aminotransferase class I/II-fold pyridoxal phosphate-dependent enzyme n=1 Tax=Micromonospora sp. HUAS YX12 TaxID=3156396 RepID=A0AAU7R502_9ACTN
MTDPEAELCAPLERFAQLHETTVRRAGTRLIDLSYPNPRADRDLRPYAALTELTATLQAADLQYTPFGGGTVVRRRVAAAVRRRTGVPFGHRDVALTPGATAALTVTLSTLFRPGDRIAMVVPCWMDYPLYANRLGLRLTGIPSGPDKRLDLDALADTLHDPPAGIVLSQPVCPTGVVHDAAELAELARLLRAAADRAGRRIVLVSDEVHRDQVWDDDPNIPLPVSYHPDTVSVYSFGKSWSLQGQRTGYLALGPGLRDPMLLRSLDRALRATAFCAPTALMQQLVLQTVDLEPDNRTLGTDQYRVRSLLSRMGYEVTAGRATSFVYVRCPAGLDDWTFVHRLADRGLLVMPSSIFHEPGWFRLALNVDGERLAVATERLRQAHPAADAADAGSIQGRA